MISGGVAPGLAAALGRAGSGISSGTDGPFTVNPGGVNRPASPKALGQAHSPHTLYKAIGHSLRYHGSGTYVPFNPAQPQHPITTSYGYSIGQG